MIAFRGKNPSKGKESLSYGDIYISVVYIPYFSDEFLYGVVVTSFGGVQIFDSDYLYLRLT
ncbi:hypothetical protein SLEP1_g16625 [Rubroshorea leprosula]|uniref:Uncharacterized protein n=1 Tax=Rubroshorea leprosula TaxID=152421 RepID=A0AAV5J0P0_9ROSI|nr:hypothetical protein SLEP1_g16625 [Rubroshorea leprosula]